LAIPLLPAAEADLLFARKSGKSPFCPRLAKGSYLLQTATISQIARSAGISMLYQGQKKGGPDFSVRSGVA
jgi:hypothetical protein